MNLRGIAVLAATVFVVLGSTAAVARPGHGGHHHYRGGARVVFYAAPLIAGAYIASRYYYPPAYYYPPPPPVYIEQPAPYEVAPQAQPQSQAYWYYCPSSRAYYPHVQSCSSGWQRVAPQPPPG